MQCDPTSPRDVSAASGRPDDSEQTTLEEQIASAQADRIARAISEIRVQRARRDHARTQLADAARDFETAIVIASKAGASLRELEEPSGLQKSYIGELVKRGRSGR